MDGKSLEILELRVILERLSSFAAFSASKALALDLKPTAHHDIALRRQNETSEARHLLSVNSALSVGGAHDVRAQAEGASRGVVLEPVGLLDIKSTMISARNLKRTFESSSTQAPLLAERADASRCRSLCPACRQADFRPNAKSDTRSALGAKRW